MDKNQRRARINMLTGPPQLAPGIKKQSRDYARYIGSLLLMCMVIVALLLVVGFASIL